MNVQIHSNSEFRQVDHKHASEVVAKHVEHSKHPLSYEGLFKMCEYLHHVRKCLEIADRAGYRLLNVREERSYIFSSIVRDVSEDRHGYKYWK